MAKSFLILLRHADKSPQGDLSPLGWGQSWLWVQGFAWGIWPWPQMLWSSPALRARQTLWPLQKFTQAPLEVLPDLHLRQPNETLETFLKRLKRLWDDIESYPGNLIVCTHQDVVARMLSLKGLDLNETVIKPLEFWIFEKPAIKLIYQGSMFV